MTDLRFVQSVIYMCSHSDEGAMGLIVNKPATEIRFDELVAHLGLPKGGAHRDMRVHFGGPVDMAHGFVLHSDDYTSDEETIDVAPGIRLSATLDVVADLAQGGGPSASLLALGYAGWGPGQLEGELAENGWLVAPARDDILFGRANEHKWTAALRSIGVDPVMLSTDGGRA